LFASIFNYENGWWIHDDDNYRNRSNIHTYSSSIGESRREGVGIGIPGEFEVAHDLKELIVLGAVVVEIVGGELLGRRRRHPATAAAGWGQIRKRAMVEKWNGNQGRYSRIESREDAVGGLGRLS
jgi:hypothetical protein